MTEQTSGGGAARGIIEIIIGGGMNSLAELSDGSVIMLLPGQRATQVSSDMGKTLTEPKQIMCDGKPLEAGPFGLSRLTSGKLALTCSEGEWMFMAESADDGQSWNTVGRIGRTADGAPCLDVMIELKSGRLLMLVRWCAAGEHPDLCQSAATAGGRATHKRSKATATRPILILPLSITRTIKAKPGSEARVT